MRAINISNPLDRMSMTVYGGRPGPFGNPFPMKGVSAAERRRVCDAFEAYARKSPALLEKIRALPEHAVIGCYCMPLQCHVERIIKIWKELHNVREAASKTTGPDTTGLPSHDPDQHPKRAT